MGSAEAIHQCRKIAVYRDEDSPLGDRLTQQRGVTRIRPLLAGSENIVPGVPQPLSEALPCTAIN